MKDPILANILSDFADVYRLDAFDEHKRFEHLANYAVMSRIIPDSFDLEDVHVGTGKDGGIDGIAIIVNEHLVDAPEAVDDLIKRLRRLDVRFIFVQAKTAAHFDGGDIAKFLHGVEAFFDPSSSLPVSDTIEQLRNLRGHIYSNSVKMERNPLCDMYYLTTGEWKEDKTLLSLIDRSKKNLDKTHYFSDVRFTPIDRQRLIQIYRGIKNKAIREIDFEKHTIFPNMSGVEEAYIGLLPGIQYLKLICDDDGLLQRNLFYDNVRDFQGMNMVNTAIRDTVSDEVQRRYFSLLNNGITVVARSVNKVGSRFKLVDYQIVNGCQTSHILYMNKDFVSNDVMIPLKLIVTQDPDLTKRVIEATNSQTEVKREAFEALSSFHKDLESLYQAIKINGRNLYYERRSKQYEQEEINKRDIISLPKQLKCFLAVFLEEPHSVQRYYGEVLDAYRPRLFQSEHSGHPYFSSAYALVVVEQLLKTEQISLRYARFKYHLMMIVRIISAGRKVPKIAGKEIQEYCGKMMEKLSDKDDALAAFRRAADIIDLALKEMDGSVKKEAERLKEFTAEILRILTDQPVQSERVGPKSKLIAARLRGVVRKYDHDRGFGFIRDALGEDYFVHITNVSGGRLEHGDTVEFSVSQTSRGPQATDVTIVPS